MFFLLYKAWGLSSNQCIQGFKKAHQIKKIGHTGTLDPLATGLLLVATDDETKLIPYLKNTDKVYFVELKLGQISATYDAQGPLTFVNDFEPDWNTVQATVATMLGTIEQIPPVFSAKKIGGQRAYHLARKQENVKLTKQLVEIKTIKNLTYEYPLISFEVWVSSGTYIRSLVHDLGLKLETGAYVTKLERIMISGFNLNDLQNTNLKPELNLTNQPIDLQQLKLLYYGQKSHFANWIDGHYALTYKEEFIGIVEVQNHLVIKQKLFGKKIIAFLE